MKYPLSKNYGAGSILFGDEERKELMDVLETGYLFRYGEDDDPNFQGKVYKFEREYAEYVGAEYCVATNSGTTSLLCALAALGIGPGDEVIVPGYTYIASISSIVNSRAVPVLAEIDESMTIDPEDIKKKITPKTKAIMPVHMIGNPCRMDEIMAIAKEHGLYVIEDCCQCVGGSYKGKKVGTFGEIGCFSFNRFKTINCGDGGCMVTSDKDLYERAFAFQDQGNVPLRKGTKEGPRTIMGLNYRMNELSGAACRGQLRRLDYIVSTLKKNKAMIKNELKKIDGVKFRVINDEDGEINTLLTLQFDTVEKADKFCRYIRI
ncbi:MAG: DegT/DnrJ/EryC1/StrS family aminotransferase [Acetivibrionales bacterium]